MIVFFFLFYDYCEAIFIKIRREKHVNEYPDYVDLSETSCPPGYHFQTGDKIGNPTEIESKRANEIDECGQRCDENERCRSIEWSDSEKNCVLLTAETTDGPKWKDYRFCSKIKGKPCIKDPLKDYHQFFLNFVHKSGVLYSFLLFLGDCFERNIDRPHRGRVHVTYSATECQKMCQKVEKCKYFTWRRDNKECWLKKERGGSDPNENAVSGPKFC